MAGGQCAEPGGYPVDGLGVVREFLDAGALPTLHDRYGLSMDAIVATVLRELG